MLNISHYKVVCSDEIITPGMMTGTVNWIGGNEKGRSDITDIGREKETGRQGTGPEIGPRRRMQKAVKVIAGEKEKETETGIIINVLFTSMIVGCL